MTKLIGKVTIEYIDKWPNTPNLTLAKKLFAEHPKLFLSTEHARSLIRYYKGRSGSLRLGHLKDKSRVVSGVPVFNPFDLPVSEAEDDTIFVLPKQYNRVGIFADVHVPYHDVDALTIAIQHCIDSKRNAILLNGDAVDFYGLSRFDKDPRMRSFAGELDDLANIIKTLNKLFGKVFFKIGNHEERYEKYLRVKAPELLDVADFRIESLMEQRGAKCEVIYHNKVLIGKLPIVHGHEFQSKAGSPVNPARGLFMKAHTNGAVAHSHRTSQHTDKDINGRVLTAFSIGCLCGLHPEYARINNWNHGFAEVDINEDGAFDFNNYRIHKNKIWR